MVTNEVSMIHEEVLLPLQVILCLNVPLYGSAKARPTGGPLRRSCDQQGDSIGALRSDNGH